MNTLAARRCDGANSEPPSAVCLGVVIPVYNEAPTIQDILVKVLAQSCVAEVVVVDDASTDATFELLREWPQADRRVAILRHPENRGKGAAIRTGLKRITSSVVIVQDGDLEYDPADFVSMLKPILSGEATVVYGSRFASGARAKTCWWHRWCNRWLTFAANLITGQRLTDEATCYKMFRREVLLGLDLREDGFGFCPEVTAKLSRLKTRIVEVPIYYRARSHAQGKKLKLRDGWGAFCCLIKYYYGDIAR